MSSKDNEWGNIEIPGLTESEILDPRLTVKLNNKSRGKGGDPIWLKKTIESNKAKAKTEYWQEANKRGAKKRALDPEWRKANRKGAKSRSEKGKMLKAQGRMEEHKKLFGYIEKHSKKTLKQMSSSAKKRWAKYKRPKVIADGVEYENFIVCAEKLGIHKDTVTYRCKSKSKIWGGWYFIEQRNKSIQPKGHK